MEIPKEFRYNPNAKYNPNTRYKQKKLNLVNQTIFVNKDHSFTKTFPNLFYNYQNPALHTNEPWNTWLHSSFDWWQCQLNFAVWCASTGCGVSYQDHIDNTEGLMKTMYTFHLYYCVSKIIKELKTPLPTDSSFCYYKNSYDKAAYQSICDKFNLKYDIDWRQRVDGGCQGLGHYSQYFQPDANYRADNPSEGPFFNINDSISHAVDISNAWTTFILDKSEGFTLEGKVRIKESIRIFVWALLGSQSEIRSDILNVGSGIEAQRQFLVDVNYAINSTIDVPTQKIKFNSVLKYARSKVDYMYGLDLTMSPSDMVLQIGVIADYNNKIIVATTSQHLGLNEEINIKPVESNTPTNTINGTSTKKSLPEPVINDSTTKKSLPDSSSAKQHEDDKMALIVGSVIAGIIAFTIYEIY